MKTFILTVSLLLLTSTSLSCQRKAPSAPVDGGPPPDGGPPGLDMSPDRDGGGGPDGQGGSDTSMSSGSDALVGPDGPQSTEASTAAKDTSPPDDRSVSDDSLPVQTFSRCVGNWPTSMPWAWQKPLAGPLRVLWTKWVGPEAVNAQRVVTNGDKLAISAGDKLYVIGRDGSTSSGTTSTAVEALTSPIADDNGRFYSAGHSFYAYDPDGHLSYWRYSFTRPLTDEWSLCKDFALSPSGLLLTTSNDGFLYAVHKTDGTLAWKRRLFSTGYTLATPSGPGVGDAFLVSYFDNGAGQFQGPQGSRLHDLATGDPIGPLLTPSGAGIFVSVIGPQGFVGEDLQGGLHLVDRCGAITWSVTSDADAPLGASLALPDGSVVAAGYTPAKTYRVSIFSATGEKLAGPVDLGPGGRPMAAGADGVLYALSCSSQDGYDAPPALLMFDRQLRSIGRLDLGLQKDDYGWYACPQSGVTIGADGVMYLVAAHPFKTADMRPGTLVIAVQTTSPGIPTGSWPLAAHDARGTNWFD